MKDYFMLGASHALAHIRKTYWMPHGQKEVSYVLFKCAVCSKYQGRPIKMPNMSPWTATKISSIYKHCIGLCRATVCQKRRIKEESSNLLVDMRYNQSNTLGNCRRYDRQSIFNVPAMILFKTRSTVRDYMQQCYTV